MQYVQLESGTVLQTSDARMWPEAKKLSAVKGKQILRDEAIAKLREWLSPGDTLHTVCRNVSRSGMSRQIDVYLLKDGEPQWLSGFAARALDWPQAKNEAIKVSGCGMDMGFHLVYSLSRILFPDGFKVEGTGRNGDKSGHDNDGGYALKQRWL